MKRLLIFLSLLIVSLLGGAHEFWLEPDRFFYRVGENVRIHFKVGENFIGEPWNAHPNRIDRIELHSLKKVSDLKNAVKESAADPLQVLLASEGTHMLVMQSHNSFIKLDGEKFTEYLKEDGLDEILALRSKTQTASDSAAEFYSRHTKLIIQAGSKTDETYKKICHLPLEIIPETNPYALKKGDVIKFKILFQGKPLFGAKVKVWNRHDHRTTVQNIFSQQDGMIETHVSNPGAWMVSVVKMVPSKDPQAEWQSYWGSLAFGVKK